MNPRISLSRDPAAGPVVGVASSATGATLGLAPAFAFAFDTLIVALGCVVVLVVGGGIGADGVGVAA